MISIGLARIGNDPVLRHTSSGDAVIELNLSTNYGRKGQDGKRPTQWIKASLWGKRAESLAPYLVKGQQVMVNLSDVHVELYEKKDGTAGASLVAKVSEIEFAGSKPEQKPEPKVTSETFAGLDDDIPNW